MNRTDYQGAMRLIFATLLVFSLAPNAIGQVQKAPGGITGSALWSGACGTAFGFGQSRLLLAANVNQIMKLGFDDAHDVFNIKRGIQIYNNR